MRRISEYVQFPGRCFVTQSSDTSHGVLDLEHHVDFEGAVYLSGKLVEEAAPMWGFIAPSRYEELVDKVNVLEAENARLADLVAKAAQLADVAKVVVDHFESVPVAATTDEYGY